MPLTSQMIVYNFNNFIKLNNIENNLKSKIQLIL